MKTSIALIGFMGTGKTAVGKVLVERLDKEFVELDSSIEHKAGKTIPEIFNQDGEVAFRELEIEVTREVAERKNTVIACGGGVVLKEINIERLRKGCVIVYLTASPGVILKRTLSNENERPLLEVSNKAQRIQELLRFRKPFYERAADIKIDTSKLDISSAVEQIIKKVKENESFSS